MHAGRVRATGRSSGSRSGSRTSRPDPWCGARTTPASSSSGRPRRSEMEEPACTPDPVPARGPVATICLSALASAPGPKPSCGLPGSSDGPSSNAPCLALAPGGACRAEPVTRLAGELLPHRFTLTASAAVCSLWRFPRVAPPGCYPAPCPAESGRSSSVATRGRPAGSSEPSLENPTGRIIRTTMRARRRHRVRCRCSRSPRAPSNPSARRRRSRPRSWHPVRPSRPPPRARPSSSSSTPTASRPITASRRSSRSWSAPISGRGSGGSTSSTASSTGTSGRRPTSATWSSSAP